MLFRSIKTDDTPERNKIYASCSILEIKYGFFGRHKASGVVIYDKKTAMHVINCKVGGVLDFRETDLKIKNLKVIGTLQQDKHLLEGKQ